MHDFNPTCLPCLFNDKNNNEITLAICSDRECGALIEMYIHFEPKEQFQGIPPADNERTIEWVSEMVKSNFNVIALKGDRVVGHGSLINIQEGQFCEYIIFVDPDFRNLGIGSKITDLCAQSAKEYGYRSIWLTVDIINQRAVHLYLNSGFKFSSPMDSEREMVLELLQ